MGETMETNDEGGNVEQLLRKALDAGFFENCDDVEYGKMIVIEIGTLTEVVTEVEGDAAEYLKVVHGELVPAPIFVCQGFYLTHECTGGKGQKIWFLKSDETAELLVLSPRLSRF